MLNNKELINLVNKELEQNKINYEPTNLFEPINYVLSIGGKRIRAVLCLAAYQMCSKKTNHTPALNAAIALEIFHNFTLLHDDIMDNADLRRNQPTVHKKWNENIAILSGDTMSILAYQYLCKTEDNLPKALDLFSNTAIKIFEGQQYDMDFENKKNVSEKDYIKMIGLKTAVFLACSLKMGAIIAKASDNIADVMYDIGMNLGLAFQLQDDFLDVYGDVETFGKNIGGDIVANKKTFLLINTLKLANPKDKKELLNWINKEEFNAEDKIKAVTEIYDSVSIREYTIKVIDQYIDKASQQLNELNDFDKTIIYEFIDRIKYRNK